jgi:hypothetical protein
MEYWIVGVMGCRSIISGRWGGLSVSQEWLVAGFAQGKLAQNPAIWRDAEQDEVIQAAMIRRPMPGT